VGGLWASGIQDGSEAGSPGQNPPVQLSHERRLKANNGSWTPKVAVNSPPLDDDIEGSIIGVIHQIDEDEWDEWNGNRDGWRGLYWNYNDLSLDFFLMIEYQKVSSDGEGKSLEDYYEENGNHIELDPGYMKRFIGYISIFKE
jgi:hypothetical protein